MIRYDIFRSFAYGEGGEADAACARIRFTPRVSGYAIIGGYAFDIKEGECVAELLRLTDGEHKVSIVTDTVSVAADPIIKHGGKIELSPPSPERIREASSEQRHILRELERLKAEMQSICKRINGSSVL